MNTKEEIYIDTVSGETLEKIIYHYANGDISSEWYHKDGKLHREDGPALIFYKDGEISCKRYFLNEEEINNLINKEKIFKELPIAKTKKRKIFILEEELIKE